MKNAKLILFLIFIATSCYAQQLPTENSSVLRTIIIGNDTMPLVTMPSFEIESKKVVRTKSEQRRYDRLQRNVMVAYPYAKLAGDMLKQCEVELAKIDNEQDRKEYMKLVEQKIEDEFGDELSDLSISQGVILIKLIDRETGNTSYEVVEDLRGKFSAFFWQGLARLFGHNLKDEFDSNGDEKMIEEIMAMIESGNMPYIARKKQHH